MALPFSINKSKYDTLSDDMKKEYIAGEKDGEFVLDVTGLPTPEDTGPLKGALQRERDNVKTLKTELSTLKTQIAEMPDIEAMKTQHGKELGKYKGFTEKTLLDGTASSMAAKISTAPKLLADHIKSRLEVDLSGDEPVVKIKGADGKINPELTLEKLQAEVVANPDYKPIIIGSKASGGGAPQNPTIKPLGGGAPKDGEQAVVPDLSKMSGKDLAARIQAKKETQAAEAAQS